MININTISQQKCKNNISYKKLMDITLLEAGDRITTSMMDNNYEYSVIGGGVLPTGKYNKFNREKCITISRAGSAGFVNWQEQKFWATDVCFTVSLNNNFMNIKYIYYYLKNFQYDLQNHIYGGSLPKLEKNYLWNYLIPVIPLEIQNEIVEILDKFQKNIEIKTLELEKRKVQREYIIQKLLFSDSYKRFKIKDLCTITKGKTAIQKAKPGKYPLVVTTNVRKSCENYQFDTEAVCIPLVSSRGHGIASLNHVYYQEGKFALGNILCALESIDKSQLLTKYLYHFFENTKEYTLVPLMKGGANVALHMNDIYDIEIVIPSLNVQEKIIQILSIVDSYIKIITKEIELRNQQYEYYRNKLLSFEELSVSE